MQDFWSNFDISDSSVKTICIHLDKAELSPLTYLGCTTYTIDENVTFKHIYVGYIDVLNDLGSVVFSSFYLQKLGNL